MLILVYSIVNCNSTEQCELYSSGVVMVYVQYTKIAAHTYICIFLSLVRYDDCSIRIFQPCIKSKIFA